jgi:hypothetical protein
MIFKCYSTRTLDTLRASLLDHGFNSYQLDGSAIADEATFLQEFVRNVPYEVYAPGDVGLTVNWDAFADCLWGGLKGRPEERVAILWLAAERLLERNLSLLLEAVETISFEAHKLLGPEHPVLLRVFLIGEGENFADFPSGLAPF